VRAFYGRLIGLEEKQPPAALAESRLVWFAAGEGELEIHFIPTTEPLVENEQHFCLAVDDVDAYRERLSAAGVTIIEATPIPGRPRFFCRDPFGNLVELTTLLGHTTQE
jgi:catechol 2,3-dioxygenase-like lactoylglutathione lyase family enzyme